MIAVDTNVLLHAHRADAPLHAAASAAVRELAEGAAPWALPWPCLHEFVAVATHPRVFDPPTPLDRAADQVGAWLESPVVVLLTEGLDHWERLRAVMDASATVGARVHDARIAAICLSAGVRELWTVDRDFSRFPDLVTRNPLS